MPNQLSDLAKTICICTAGSIEYDFICIHINWNLHFAQLCTTYGQGVVFCDSS